MGGRYEETPGETEGNDWNVVYSNLFHQTDEIHFPMLLLHNLN